MTGEQEKFIAWMKDSENGTEMIENIAQVLRIHSYKYCRNFDDESESTRNKKKFAEVMSELFDDTIPE